MTLGAIAEQHAQDEFALLQLKPRRKEPLQGSHGYKDATNDLSRVREMWGERPDCNPGIACQRSGLIVADIDPRNGGDDTWQAKCDEHGDIKTETVMTPSGGLHKYFLLPNGLRIRTGKDRLGRGVDVTNYIVGPGGVTTGEYIVDDLHEPYRLRRERMSFAPDWILRIATKQAHETERPESRSSGVSGVSGLSVSSVDDLISKTIPLECGTRNTKILLFARGLKFDLGMADASRDELRPLVMRWWEASLPNIRTKDFTDTWADFGNAFENAKFPLLGDIATIAFDNAKKHPGAPMLVWSGSDQINLLAATCRELQKLKGFGSDGKPLPFSLSCSQVARLLWHCTADDLRWKATRWLKLLCREGVLKLIKRGEPGPPGLPASRYIYIRETQ